MPPISTNLADKGYITDTLVEHYAARAKGGVGLIVTEVTTVEPVHTYLPGDISICDDSYIPGWENWPQPYINTELKSFPNCFIRHTWPSPFQVPRALSPLQMWGHPMQKKLRDLSPYRN